MNKIPTLTAEIKFTPSCSACGLEIPAPSVIYINNTFCISPAFCPHCNCKFTNAFSDHEIIQLDIRKK